MAIYRKMRELELAQASQLLMAEGISLPRRVGCLGLKAFHDLSELDASLGKLGSRKVHKMTLLPLFPCTFCFLDQNPK